MPEGYRPELTRKQRNLRLALLALTATFMFACSMAHPNPTEKPPPTDVPPPTATHNLTPAHLRDKSADLNPTLTPTPEGTSVFSADVVPQATGVAVFP